MKDYLCAVMYKWLRWILFWFDPERVHYWAMNGLSLLCSIGPVRRWLAARFQPLSGGGAELMGLSFPNVVGLGAGFDKNARYLRELQTLGFGFVEIGTVTPMPQAGNDKPRLFRLPKDKALINRMGFNNDGLVAVVKRLQQWRLHTDSDLLIGGNIGKNKQTPNETAREDYGCCFVALYPYVDYFVVNVSSPNTPGLRALQEKAALKEILTHLQQLRTAFTSYKPILLKIAPDLSPEQLDEVAALAVDIRLDGLVCSNTTISRAGLVTPAAVVEKMGAGGLSGLPVRCRATEVVEHIHRQTGGQLPIIASGGIFNAADAKEKMAAGASLVQVWTGFVYEGPAIVKNICRGLLQS